MAYERLRLTDKYESVSIYIRISGKTSNTQLHVGGNEYTDIQLCREVSSCFLETTIKVSQ